MTQGRLVRYALRRLAIALPQLVVITALVFVLMRVLPADPVARLLGLDTSPAAYAKAKQSLGLDRPIYDQFGSFLGGIVHFDLGKSWSTSDSITREIGAHLPITIQLIVMSFSIALLIALPLGIISATRPGSKLDKLVFGYGLFAGAQPDFWWGLMFALLFVYKLKIFPAPVGLPHPEGTTITGFSLIDTLLQGNWGGFRSVLGYYLLPALTMAFVITGPIVKMIRQNMVGVLESDYILQARASGFRPNRVARAALMPALAPVITLVGILFGFMLGGSVLIETIFSLNGLGAYAVERTLQLDYPAIQGVVLVMTGFSLIVYLAMDVLYAVIDPRIRY